jgi:uroporphyrin-III C-methyltransferase
VKKAQRPPAPRAGRVFLVGAGPGDPELMTLKAVRVLQSADVVLHDALVNPEILRWAPPGARIVAVGKRGGCRSTPQKFILRLLVAEARKGHVVVRLKGGDPFVFGRGGEERQYLHAAGIEVAVVNGITAGIAGPTGLGVPLTDRGHAQGVIFVTGHGKDGGEPSWVSLARTGLTLLIYMGVARAPAIRAGLLDGGMPADMPVAVVQNATLPSARAIRSSLGDFPEAIAAAGLGSPAIIVIGRVVDLAMALPQAVSATAADRRIRRN